MIRCIPSPFGTLQLEESSETHPFSPLAQLALDHLPLKKGMKVLDLGTGSGVYAMVMAQAGCKVLATDIHESILEQACENAKRNEIEGIEWKKASYFEGLEGRPFDLVVSNLPQTPAPSPITLAKWGGPLGRTHLESILYSAPKYLTSGGKLILTHLGLAGGPDRFQHFSSHFEITLLGSLKRILVPEEYERYQTGLWKYLLTLRDQQESEILEESNQYFCYGRVFQYRKRS